MYPHIAGLWWRRFRSEDSGQDLLEYALLVALIVVVAVSAVTEVGSTIKTVFWDVIAASSNSI
jgi:Flp pilus assembly pilin Flp